MSLWSRLAIRASAEVGSALTARANDRKLVGRHVVDIVLVDQGPVGRIQKTQLDRSRDVRLHAPANHGDHAAEVGETSITCCTRDMSDANVETIIRPCASANTDSKLRR